MRHAVEQVLDELMARYPALAAAKADIVKAYQLLEKTYEGGGKVLCAGNGGSAADAEHIVGELMKGFHLARALAPGERAALEKAGGEQGRWLGERLQGALPALSLVGNVALQTAFSNDVDGAAGVAQQVYALGTTGDVFWGLSTSGNSQNILLGAIAAKAKGTKVLGLTGESGGKLKALADVCICVPHTRVDCIQELHLPVYHCLCAMLEVRFFGQA
ncbi:MAG: SIS domain-containing protein [Oscillospiraceae bacterium]